jgi:hypothetical protein
LLRGLLMGFALRAQPILLRIDLLRIERARGVAEGVPRARSPSLQVDAMMIMETAMNELTRIEIERDVADTAARRAAEEGMTVTAYVSQLLRRAFERAPGEESVLAYDHVGGDDVAHIDREAGEDDDQHRRRRDLYDTVFGRR